jgi:integration host factor subunit alpha
LRLAVFTEATLAITKAELVEIVKEKTRFTGQESAAFVEQVFQILKEILEKGEKVKISGFGNFVTREKRPRKGRNPKTREPIMISGRRVLTFKPSAILRKVVNGGNQSSGKSEIEK